MIIQKCLTWVRLHEPEFPKVSSFDEFKVEDCGSVISGDATFDGSEKQVGIKVLGCASKLTITNGAY